MEEAMIVYHQDGTIPTDGEIFVFGSNLAGRHGAGAAKIAREKFGAHYGISFGMTGQSYAIPTKDGTLRTLPIYVIKQYVDTFKTITGSPMFSNTRWFVSRVGCGLAGYLDEEIAPLFRGAQNCSFAEQWKEFIE
jgi:hypothetical protein